MKSLARLLAIAALSFAGLAPSARADGFPDKPLRLVVPFAPGGSVDLIGRILAQRLGERLGQQVIVDNRPGAGGTLGADAVARAAPDGHTLLLASSAHQSFHGLLYKKLPYDPAKAFAQVALFASVPNVLVVSKQVPAQNVQALVALAKPGGGRRLFMGSSGTGGVNHLIGEYFQMQTGAGFEHVPYKGAGPANNDLLSGQIDLMFVNLPTVLPHIQAGRLRALAVASAQRSAALPDVPTMAEAGVPDFVADSWAGVLAPAGTPPAVLARLGAEIVAIAKEKATAQSLAAQGAVPMPGTAADYAALVQAETRRWTDVIRRADITLD